MFLLCGQTEMSSTDTRPAIRQKESLNKSQNFSWYWIEMTVIETVSITHIKVAHLTLF